MDKTPDTSTSAPESGREEACTTSTTPATTTPGTPDVVFSDVVRKEQDANGNFRNDFVFLADDRQLWNASVVLLRHLTSPGSNTSWKGKRVLELGSGMGHLAFELAQKGAVVHCTEQPKCLAVLQDTLDRQFRERSDLTAEFVKPTVSALRWGDSAAFAQLCTHLDLKSIDYVICSELFYDEGVHEALAATWELIMERFPDSVIFSIFVNRPFSWNFFATVDDRGFIKVDSIDDFDAFGLEDVHMHRSTRKVESQGKNKINVEEAIPKPTTKASSTTTTTTSATLLPPEEDELDPLAATSGDCGLGTSTKKTNRNREASREDPAPLAARGKGVDRDREDKTSSSETIKTDETTETEGAAVEGDNEKTIWEILDELIGIDPKKLRLYVQGALLVLVAISASLIRNAYNEREFSLVYLHSGFLFCVVMLSLSVEFVLAEAERLTKEQEAARRTLENKGEQLEQPLVNAGTDHDEELESSTSASAREGASKLQLKKSDCQAPR